MTTPNQRYFIKLRIPSEMKLIHFLATISTGILKEMGFDKEDVEQTTMAIIEAGTNAIRHGNKNDPSKMVNFQFHKDEDKLTVVVQDEGEGFDINKLPNPLAPENLLKTNGRGIFMMNMCMNEVIFNKKGSEVQMVKYK